MTAKSKEQKSTYPCEAVAVDQLEHAAVDGEYSADEQVLGLQEGASDAVLGELVSLEHGSGDQTAVILLGLHQGQSVVLEVVGQHDLANARALHGGVIDVCKQSINQGRL